MTNDEQPPIERVTCGLCGAKTDTWFLKARDRFACENCSQRLDVISDQMTGLAIALDDWAQVVCDADLDSTMVEYIAARWSDIEDAWRKIEASATGTKGTVEREAKKMIHEDAWACSQCGKQYARGEGVDDQWQNGEGVEFCHSCLFSNPPDCKGAKMTGHPTEHTPTPWGIEVDDNRLVLRGPFGQYITVGFAYPEDAAFICRAVNAHADLLAACEAVESELLPSDGALPKTPTKIGRISKMVRAAITKARLLPAPKAMSRLAAGDVSGEQIEAGLSAMNRVVAGNLDAGQAKEAEK